MHIAVGKQRIESLYRTDSGEIELKEQMIKNNEASCNAPVSIKVYPAVREVVDKKESPY